MQVWPFDLALRWQVMQMGQGTQIHQQVNLNGDNVPMKKAFAFVPLVAALAHPIPSGN